VKEISFFKWKFFKRIAISSAKSLQLVASPICFSGGINPLTDLGSHQFLQEADLYDVLDSEKSLSILKNSKKLNP